MSTLRCILGGSLLTVILLVPRTTYMVFTFFTFATLDLDPWPFPLALYRKLALLKYLFPPCFFCPSVCLLSHMTHELQCENADDVHEWEIFLTSSFSQVSLDLFPLPRIWGAGCHSGMGRGWRSGDGERLAFITGEKPRLLPHYTCTQLTSLQTSTPPPQLKLHGYDRCWERLNRNLIGGWLSSVGGAYWPNQLELSIATGIERYSKRPWFHPFGFHVVVWMWKAWKLFHMCILSRVYSFRDSQNRSTTENGTC